MQFKKQNDFSRRLIAITTALAIAFSTLSVFAAITGDSKSVVRAHGHDHIVTLSSDAQGHDRVSDHAHASVKHHISHQQMSTNGISGTEHAIAIVHLHDISFAIRTVNSWNQIFVRVGAPVFNWATQYASTNPKGSLPRTSWQLLQYQTLKTIRSVVLLT